MDEEGDKSTVSVPVELSVPDATVQIARFVLVDPIDNIFQADDCYRLNLCLTPRPRNTRACFFELWGPHRFEPLGDLFLLPPGRSLHVRGEGGRQVSIVCQLRPELVERWLGEDLEWTDRRLEASLDVSNPHIRALLIRLAEEAHRPGLASEALAEMIAGQLAIEIGRFCVAIEEKPATGGLASWRLRLIDERLRNLRSPPTLAELAVMCNLSVRQLTRGFRTSRGVSISEYTAHSRIEGAKRLLAGEDSVKAIAFATGFASPSSFAYAFRRATGSTPRQFRQRMLRAVF